MQIVIDIPEKTINEIKDNAMFDVCISSDIRWNVTSAIENGTPLPKGHGALIDISNIDVIELEDSMHYIRHEKGDEVDVYISAPTIIEVDREVEE